jgi:hypothetical protein
MVGGRGAAEREGEAGRARRHKRQGSDLVVDIHELKGLGFRV